jgi:hypothetical protein
MLAIRPHPVVGLAVRKWPHECALFVMLNQNQSPLAWG